MLRFTMVSDQKILYFVSAKFVFTDAILNILSVHKKPHNMDHDPDNWEGDMAPEVTPTKEETSHELKYMVSEADYNVSISVL